MHRNDFHTNLVVGARRDQHRVKSKVAYRSFYSGVKKNIQRLRRLPLRSRAVPTSDLLLRPACFLSLRRQPSTTLGVRPSGVLIMRKLWKPAEAHTRRNMHPDRFRNRFGADTAGIWLRNPKFWLLRPVSAPKWSQNGSRCVSVFVCP